MRTVFNTPDYFADIRGKRMSELDAEQLTRAHELWCREQIAYFDEYHRKHIEKLLAMIDTLRCQNSSELVGLRAENEILKQGYMPAGFTAYPKAEIERLQRIAELVKKLDLDADSHKIAYREIFELDALLSQPKKSIMEDSSPYNLMSIGSRSNKTENDT